MRDISIIDAYYLNLRHVYLLWTGLVEGVWRPAAVAVLPSCLLSMTALCQRYENTVQSYWKAESAIPRMAPSPLPYFCSNECLFTDSSVVISTLHVLSYSTMLGAVVAPDTRVVPHLCPLPLQVIHREAKRCAPAPCPNPPCSRTPPQRQAG